MCVYDILILIASSVSYVTVFPTQACSRQTKILTDREVDRHRQTKKHTETDRQAGRYR